MAPIPIPAHQRAQRALALVAQHGGFYSFPTVLCSCDVTPLMGRDWFMTQLHKQQLPGIQVVPRGVWRCERETFFKWLKEISDETSLSLAITG